MNATPSLLDALQVQPSTFFLGETKVDREGMNDMLRHLGVLDQFSTDAPSGSEEMIEVAGRLCYMSFDTKLNLNLTRTRTGNAPYVQNILSSGHGSVLEHGFINFGIMDCSPILTHELVRHRAGTGFSQQSGRYVAIDRENSGFFFPGAFREAVESGKMTEDELRQLEAEANEYLEGVFAFQDRLVSLTHIREEGYDFALKKKLTSAFRRFAAAGLRTRIIFSANHRALRHIIALRNDIHAEEEVRIVAFQIGGMMKSRFPNVYSDMELVEITNSATGRVEQVWKFANNKV